MTETAWDFQRLNAYYLSRYRTSAHPSFTPCHAGVWVWVPTVSSVAQLCAGGAPGVYRVSPTPCWKIMPSQLCGTELPFMRGSTDASSYPRDSATKQRPRWLAHSPRPPSAALSTPKEEKPRGSVGTRSGVNGPWWDWPDFSDMGQRATATADPRQRPASPLAAVPQRSRVA